MACALAGRVLAEDFAGSCLGSAFRSSRLAHGELSEKAPTPPEMQRAKGSGRGSIAWG